MSKLFTFNPKRIKTGFEFYAKFRKDEDYDKEGNLEEVENVFNLKTLIENFNNAEVKYKEANKTTAESIIDLLGLDSKYLLNPKENVVSLFNILIGKNSDDLEFNPSMEIELWNHGNNTCYHPHHGIVNEGNIYLFADAIAGERETANVYKVKFTLVRLIPSPNDRLTISHL